MSALLRPFRAMRRLVRHLVAAREDIAARDLMACVSPATTGTTSIRVTREGGWLIVRTLRRDLQPQEVCIHESMVGPLMAALASTAAGGTR